MAERFKLNQVEVSTPLWHAISAHYEARLANLRAQNDSMTLGKKKTAELRGRIAEIRGLLKLDQPDKGTT